MMAGAVIYLLVNEGSMVKVYYKGVSGFYPEMFVIVKKCGRLGR